MADKIDKLTPEQEADMYKYRTQRWYQLISPEVEQSTVEECMKEIYSIVGAKPIKRFIWLDSPLQLLEIHRGNAKLPPQEGEIPDGFDDEAVIAALQELDNGFITNPWLNEWMGCWVSFYAWCSKIVDYNPEDLRKLKILEKLTAAAGWVYPFEEVCFCCRRPITKWNLEDPSMGTPVLHNPTGPAIEFRDGMKEYHWRGTKVPAEWIEDKENVDPKLALTWRNIEQRRALAEIIGWKKVIDQLDAKVIDADEDDEIGTLLEVELPEVGKARFLKVECATGRTFVLSVPIEMKTALEANAWTFPGMTVEDILGRELRT
jgi:hypothetical protein